MRKILIANRGEIAVRINRACHKKGYQTVVVYSEADRESLPVFYTDEAVCIGEAPSQKSYLNIASILAACEITGADAVHPGYGFLSENAKFASICESCGLVFIGPSPYSISLLGDKARAKATAKSVGCPVIPGSEGVVHELRDALNEALKIGFPLFIKASAGGGGKGIRIAHNLEEFTKQFAAARAEAESNFGNPDVYLEKMIVSPRHVEFQVLGDKHGNYIHLGERDCTIQRRRQKLIEESPSPALTSALRAKMGQMAIEIVKAAKYFSAGTVEFLLDKDHNFYFMEVNTRIQVEHPVTEELTGIDLVEEQLNIAKGDKLSLRQEDVQFKGHVIQYRINAENPKQGFSPCPGEIDYLPPGGPGIRVDSACYPKYRIPPYYDSLIAKLIVKGRTREEAIAVGQAALSEFYISGVPSTIPFHLYMSRDPKFQSGKFDLGYIDGLIAEGCTFE